MEIGMSYNISPVYQVSSSSLFSGNDLGVFQLNNQINEPLYSNRGESLNTTCLKLNSNPTVLIAGVAPNGASVSYSSDSMSYQESKKLQQFLTSIPIYHEVLDFKANKNDSAYQEFQGISSQQTDIGMFYKPSERNFPRKRMSSASLVEKDCDEAGTPYLNSTAQSYSAHSNPDSSHPVLEDNMVRSEFQPIASNFMGYSRTHVPTSYTSGELGGNSRNTSELKAIILPEGAKAVIPPGYIQVQKEKNCNRKTKVITHCEHTNRKHYAKGLCSTCYHKAGRTKLAWKCQHHDKLHYAKGCCQDCYLTFHSKRGQNKLRRLMSRKQEANSYMF